MKKISKYLKISTFAFVLAMMCFVSVSAGTLAFTEATPILQGWKELSERTKDQSSYMSGVILSRKDNDALQFQARGKNSSGNWNSWYITTVVTQTNQNFVVHFDNNYGTGTKVQARFRNNSWNLNTGTTIGNWQYF